MSSVWKRTGRTKGAARVAERFKEAFDIVLERVEHMQILGQVTVAEGTDIYYPKILLVTVCGEHVIAETLGLSRERIPLTVKTHELDSAYRYLYQFDDQPHNPLMRWTTKMDPVVSGVAMRPNDVNLNKTHFNFHQGWLSRGVNFAYDKERHPFEVGPECTLALQDLQLVNVRDDKIRLRYISFAWVVARQRLEKTSQKDLVALLLAHAIKRNIIPVLAVPRTGGTFRTIAAQFAATFLCPGLQETTIGQFIGAHPELITDALGYRTIHREKRLVWVDGVHDADDQYLQPDLLLERHDGTCDIGDLKLALSDKSPFIVGGKKRRRFGAGVYDGLAQLAEYREYFSTPENCRYAKETHGITLAENAKLILLIGNLDDMPKDQAEQAMRMTQGASVTVLDYHTLCAAFVATHDPGPSTS